VATAGNVTAIALSNSACTLVADNLNAPSGLAFDGSGNLYVGCVGSGSVVRIAISIRRRHWSATTFATGLFTYSGNS
jgi:hypothetical protein